MGSDSWKTWVGVFALIVFAGVASAAWPFFSDRLGGGEGQSVEHEPEVVTIDYTAFLPSLAANIRQIRFIERGDGYLIDATALEGRQLSDYQVLGLLIGVTLVSIGLLGLPLALIYTRLGTQVEKTYASDSYQEARSRLSQKEDGRLKSQRSQKPANNEQKEPRWPAISTGLVILIFVWLTAVILGKEFFGENELVSGNRVYDPVGLFSLALVVVAAVILVLVMRGRTAAEIDTPDTDNRPVNWGMVWVVLSGILVVGVGAGLAVVMRAAGG